MGLFDRVKKIFGYGERSEDETFMIDLQTREWLVLNVCQQEHTLQGAFYIEMPSGGTMLLKDALQIIFNATILGEHKKLDIEWNGLSDGWSNERKKAFVNLMHAMVDATNSFFNEKGYEYLKPLWLMSVQSWDEVFWQSENRDEVRQKYAKF